MKKLVWVILLLFLLGLCGCRPGSESQEDVEEETTDATEPEVKVTELTDEELLAFESRFSVMSPCGSENWWYNMALTSQYASPEELDLYTYFYNGFMDETVSQAERDRLEELGMWMELDIQKNPVPKMNEILLQYFGLTLEEASGVGLDGMIYLEETDSYYKCSGDVSVAEWAAFHRGYRMEDGRICLYYMNFLDEEWVVTLQAAPENAGVEYHVISNMPAE